jgi:hypothetical protein
MKKKDQTEAVLRAFLHGLKLGQVLNAQVDSIADHYIGLMIPATLEGSDDSDHFGQVSFDHLKKHGEISVYFDTLDERVRYAAQGCEHEASVEAGMALDSKRWQAHTTKKEKGREEASTH